MTDIKKIKNEFDPFLDILADPKTLFIDYPVLEYGYKRYLQSKWPLGLRVYILDQNCVPPKYKVFFETSFAYNRWKLSIDKEDEQKSFFTYDIPRFFSSITRRYDNNHED